MLKQLMTLLMFNEEVVETSTETQTTSETVEAEGGQVDNTEGEENQFSFEIQDNGEAYTYTDQEALRADAQKGRNYDKINTRHTELVDVIKSMGYEKVSDFIGRVQDKQYKDQLKALTDQGMDKELAEEHLRLKGVEKVAQAATEKEQAEQARKDMISNQLERFKTAFPDVAIDKLPKEVLAIAEKNGENYVEAYALHMLQTLPSQIEERTIQAVLMNGLTSAGTLVSGGISEQTSKKSKVSDMSDSDMEKLISEVKAGTRTRV